MRSGRAVKSSVPHVTKQLTSTEGSSDMQSVSSLRTNITTCLLSFVLVSSIRTEITERTKTILGIPTRRADS